MINYTQVKHTFKNPLSTENTVNWAKVIVATSAGIFFLAIGILIGVQGREASGIVAGDSSVRMPETEEFGLPAEPVEPDESYYTTDDEDEKVFVPQPLPTNSESDYLSE